MSESGGISKAWLRRSPGEHAAVRRVPGLARVGGAGAPRSGPKTHSCSI